MGTRQNRRMAERMVRRAGISGEQGVAVSFGFKSFMAAMLISFLEEIPYIGFAMTFVTFRLHRIVLVTDQHAYVFAAQPLHRPGDRLGEYPVGPGTATRVRGQLTFSDGQVVWHSPLFAARARRVADAANGGQ